MASRPCTRFPPYHTTFLVPHHFSVGVVFSDSIPCLWAGVIFVVFFRMGTCVYQPLILFGLKWWSSEADYMGGGVC